MLLVDLIAGAMVTTGASLVLILGIGLVLTRSEERERVERRDGHRGCTPRDKDLIRLGAQRRATFPKGEGLRNDK
jgi:hypothetical protein